MKRCLVLMVISLLLYLSSASAATPQRYTALQYQVSGVSDAIAKNVNETLHNFYSSLHFPLTQANVLHFYEKAPQLIKNALAPYGYFHSQIRSQLKAAPHGWTAQFQIIPGPALRITRLHIEIIGEGLHDHAFQKLLANFPITQGKPLLSEQYEKAKTMLYNLATTRGYFDAKMTKSHITIDLQNYQSVVTIIFNTGQRYRFGKTTFDGSKLSLSPIFLHRYLTYHEGQYYDGKKLEETQTGLVNSNYFKQVLIKPHSQQAKRNHVPIAISLLPRDSRTYLIGAGYGTDTGPRGTLGLTLRQLNRWGHRLQMMLRGSPDNSSYTARYLIPGSNPARDLFGLNAGISEINQAGSTANSVKFSLDYSVNTRRWKHTFALAYLNERYRIKYLPRTNTQLVYPTITSAYYHTNHPSQPTKGISLSFQESGADKSLLSRSNFFQTISTFKSLYTIRYTHTRLLFRTSYGHTIIHNLNRLPLSLQLFAGGARSIRGYGYNTIGPGRNLFTVSGEIQQRVFGDFYLAGFVDAGDVKNQQLLHDMHVGVGPGIVWLSPVGALEFTVASAITQQNKPWVIQFAMGALI